MTKKRVMQVLDILDETYGTTKQGFLHKEPWQLLLAIMLSAQSTDKQVEEALPALWERFPTIESMAKGLHKELSSQFPDLPQFKKPNESFDYCALGFLDQAIGLSTKQVKSPCAYAHGFLPF